MQKIVRKLLWVAPFWTLSLPVHGAVSVGAGTEYMSWREYEEATNDRLLEETGVRAFAGATLSISLNRRADLRGYGRIYTGDVDYDGQYQDGTPTTTVTEYLGGVGEVGIAYLAALREGREMPPAFIANLGAEAWSRNITGSGGYEEQYQVAYLRLGAEQEAPYGGWTARGGLIWPLWTHEEVGLWDGVSLEPKGKVSLFLGAGYRFRGGLETGLDYRSYRFGMSDAVFVDTDKDGVNDSYVFQPRSELDTLGLYLKYVF